VPIVMLIIVLLLAPFYIAAAWRKDDRANDLIAKCEAGGFSHQDCRRHVRNFRPLPERQAAKPAPSPRPCISMSAWSEAAGKYVTQPCK
jgi:hypothetical protein